ncbi:MAG: hypothetical protein HYY06_31765 [Deltaproteobacteria bacterium]|nr:hypothetical protein [Deltaproteobacteria bacterium]
MRRWNWLVKTAGLCSGFLVLTGAQSNGCDGIDPPIVCVEAPDPECPDGTLEDGGVDENGCPLPRVCVVEPCTIAGGVSATYCIQSEECPDGDCGCEEYCDCGPVAYFDGQACVPFPDPCSSTGGIWEEWCDGEAGDLEGGCFSYCVCPDGAFYDEWSGCVVPPDPSEICEPTGGVIATWCDDGCLDDPDAEPGQGNCGAEPEPSCTDYCDCGWNAYFDPFWGCVPIDPGELCRSTGGDYCGDYCQCPYGTYYDEWSGCVPDPYVLCVSSGGEYTVVCDDLGEDGEGACWEDCACPEGYYFDYSYGCYPEPRLLCELGGGSWGEVCDDSWGEPFCWEDCACPEGSTFDWYSGCVVDYASVCANGGGEWTTTCDEDWGECWDDCVCPEGTFFDWATGCVPNEICDNGVDDSADGAVDCDDWQCQFTEDCFVPGPEDCWNGIDDDADGFYDCEDQDCAADEICRGGLPE